MSGPQHLLPELFILAAEVKWKSLSGVPLFVTPWTVAPRFLCPLNSPGKNTRVGCHALLQGIFPTQGLNPGLPHCRRILYQLRFFSHASGVQHTGQSYQCWKLRCAEGNWIQMWVTMPRKEGEMFIGLTRPWGFYSPSVPFIILSTSLSFIKFN